MADKPDPVRDPQEEDAYWRERYRVARDLGLDKSHARAFASSATTMAELRDLIESGCPPALAERITRPDP